MSMLKSTSKQKSQKDAILHEITHAHYQTLHLQFLQLNKP